MAKYLINKEDGVPHCTVYGRVMPDCGPNAINITVSDVRYCYFCGTPMEMFYYPKGEED